jgi:hypothetical protein
MNKRKSMLTVLAASVFMVCSAFIVQGQNNRTYVSGLGSDGNSGSGCQQAAPCRTFNTAIGVTNTGGQVVAVDNAGYSGFIANKSITIEGAPGITAFIFVGVSATGMVATGTSNTDLIIIRNIFVDGLGASNTTGLSFTGPAKLVVENCTFRNLTTGVSVAGTNNTSSPARMDLINSSLFGNGTAVLSTGTGANRPGNAQSASTSMVRIDGGSITGNTIGLNQVNPGSNLGNIAVFAPGNNFFLNLVANGTDTTCSGTGCGGPIAYSMNSSGPFGP